MHFGAVFGSGGFVRRGANFFGGRSLTDADRHAESRKSTLIIIRSIIRIALLIIVILIKNTSQYVCYRICMCC